MKKASEKPRILNGEEGTPIELFLAGVAENAHTFARAVATDSASDQAL
jgi:hypothetical protein